MTSEIFDSFSEVLAQPDTVLMIGSGVSQWSDLPSWHTLIGQLCDHGSSCGHSVDAAREFLSNRNYQAAAGILFELLDESEWNEFFLVRSGFLAAEPHEVHKKIHALGPSSFITVNYDTLIEDSPACFGIEKELLVVKNDELEKLARILKGTSRDFVYKMHGDVNDPQSIVLTTEQYRKIIHSNQHVRQTLESILITRPVVMIGMGLQDRDIELVLGSVRETYGGHIEDLYAIIADVSPDECELQRKSLGVTILSYSSSNNYAEFPLLLDDLSQRAHLKRIDLQRKEETALPMARSCATDTTEADERLRQMMQSDDQLRRVILSSVHWSGPVRRSVLAARSAMSVPAASSFEIDECINRLEHEEIIGLVGDLVMPRNKELVAAIGRTRVSDAALILESA